MAVRGLTAKGVPPMAPWLLYIKIAILVLALIVLALAAYSISLFGAYAGIYYGGTGAGGFLIFIAIKTFIVIGGAVAVEIWAPRFFYRIIALIAYILSVIFWLSGWAWAASTAAVWLTSYCYGGYCSTLDSTSRSEGGALAACAGLGAVAWILSIVNLVFFIKACLAHPDGEAALHQVELGHTKQEPTATQHPAGQYPQQYQQQQAYPAQ